MRWLNRLISLFITLALWGCNAPSPGAKAERIAYYVPDSVPATPQYPLESGLPGVPNFGVITRDVWRGGEPSPSGLRLLADLGVKSIIDLRAEGDESAFVPIGVHYVRLPVSAWHADRVDVNGVLQAIASNPKPVFIHCQQGRDRTGLAIAAYRLSRGMKTREVNAELVNFHVNPWWRGAIERRIDELSRSFGTLKPTERTKSPAARS